PASRRRSKTRARPSGRSPPSPRSRARPSRARRGRTSAPADRTRAARPTLLERLSHERQVAAAPLGFVERGVREPKERLRLAGVGRARGDAEARANADALLSDAANDLACVLLGGLGEQQRELVAADPECIVA